MYCRGIYSYAIKKVEYTNDVTDKVIIVTGANSGAGIETVIKLARINAKTVILACRNERKALSALATIKKEVPNSKTNLDFM
jgi:NAD(P)-dependent dehydrogenase (short-subunit alcohol dehydrogenase family)